MTFVYYRFSATFVCRRFDAMFIYRHRRTTFICIRMIHTSKIYLISDKKLNQWSSICYRTEIIGFLVIIVILKVLA